MDDLPDTSNDEISNNKNHPRCRSPLCCAGPAVIITIICSRRAETPILELNSLNCDISFVTQTMWMPPSKHCLSRHRRYHRRLFRVYLNYFMSKQRQHWVTELAKFITLLCRQFYSFTHPLALSVHQRWLTRFCQWPTTMPHGAPYPLNSSPSLSSFVFYLFIIFFYGWSL